jgi:hypothetical protein
MSYYSLGGGAVGKCGLRFNFVVSSIRIRILPSATSSLSSSSRPRMRYTVMAWIDTSVVQVS